jgi:hypothetical protein
MWGQLVMLVALVFAACRDQSAGLSWAVSAGASRPVGRQLDSGAAGERLAADGMPPTS